MTCPHGSTAASCAICQLAEVEHGAPSDPTLRREGPPTEQGGVQVTNGRLGRFLIVETIGQGGMGVVYRGYDPALDRRVALKVLRAQMSDAGGTARLAREAQAMARLAHPNVVPVYDVGRTGESLFVAMEFVQGQTLQRWLSQARPWSVVLEVCVQAGGGLEAAHAAGIIHRDFKPANVLVGNDGRARVTDFGLARSNAEVDRSSTPIVAGAISLDTPLTIAGSVMGTPGYMAPEQYLGQQSTPATDQYAFCATLYEALYGQRPFVGPDLQTMARLTQAGAVPLPPKGASAPAWLFPIIAKGLSPNPAQRHASMAALLQLLERDPSVRRRRLVLTAAALTVTLATAAGLQVWPTVRVSSCHRETEALANVWSPQALEQAEHAFVATGLPFAGTAWALVRSTSASFSKSWAAERHRACDDTLLRQTHTERQLSLRLACLENRRVELATLTRQFERADLALVTSAAAAVSQLTSVERCANVEALEQRASMADDVRRSAEGLEQRLSEGRMLVALGRFVDAGRLLSAATDDARALNDPRTLAVVLLEAGNLARQERRHSDARALLDEALRLALASGDDRTALQALGWLASLVGWRLGQPGEALGLVNVGRGLVPRVDDPLLEGLLDEGEGDSRWRLDDGPGALAAYERSLTRFEGRQGATGLDVARIKSSIAWVLSEQGQPLRARVACEEVRRLQEALLGPDHPALQLTWTTLARIADDLDDGPGAVAAARQAYASSARTHGVQAPATAQSALTLARLLGAVGRFDEAEQLLRVAGQIPSLTPQQQYHLERNRALVWWMKGDLEAASTAVRAATALVGDDAFARVERDLVHGLIEAARGDDASARRLLESALPVYEKLGLGRRREATHAHLELAKVLLRQNERTFPEVAEVVSTNALALEGNARLKAQALVLVAKARWAKGSAVEARQAATQALSFATDADLPRLKVEAEQFLADHQAE